ncbi:glycosyltransferase involved in cell wall biosynthesis [Sphingomonas sp. F9_3S_D5_B_2]
MLITDTVADHRPVLYISYDGLTDALGRSQILPYLVGLASRGHRIHILSCEKADRFVRDGERIAPICRDADIEWHPLPYHKAPPVLSSAYDQQALRWAAARLHRRFGFGLVHCRSYIAAAAGLHLKKRFGVPLLFDMRGFWPEEKTEGKSWDLAKPLFRMVYHHFKRLESALLANADAIVSLTDAGKVELLSRPEVSDRPEAITVIPCCVEFGHFALARIGVRDAARTELGIPPAAPVLAYLGSLGGNYMLAEMLEFFGVYRERYGRAVFLFVTQDNPDAIREQAAAHRIDSDELVIRAASREDVPRFLAAADVGVAFKQPSFSARGCSPTKMGEMLAVGLPFVANAGVGDVADIIAETACGAAVQTFDADSYRRALDQVEQCSTSSEQRRHRAQAVYDVELGIARYDRLYRSLPVEKPAASKAASSRAVNSSRE